MKRNIRLGDRCALTKHNLKRFKIRYISRLAVATIMCLYAVKQVSAQEAEPVATAVSDIKPLQIGDTIPEYLWHLPLQVVNHPDGKDTITLNEYRHKKLIIIDFWATYCKPCIKSIAKIDSIITELDTDEVVLLPVHVYNDASKALPYMEKNGWKMPSIVNDTTLNKIAFYNYLTGFGVVWIGNGRLIAVPRIKYVTQDNVTKAIRGEQLFIENRKGYPLRNQ